MLETSGGFSQLSDGTEREITQIVMAREGQIIEGNLSKPLVDRYEANDPYVRSLVEYGEMELQDVEGEDEPQRVFVPKGPDASPDEDDAVPQTDEALVAENQELREQVSGLEQQVSDLSDANSALASERIELTEQVQSLQADLEAATAPAAAAGDAQPAGEEPSGQYDPTQYKVDDVLGYLAQASPEEVERVKAAEAASERNSTQIAGFQPREASS
jgi:FtsZ-binding cell division protein ZapB